MRANRQLRAPRMFARKRAPAPDQVVMDCAMTGSRRLGGCPSSLFREPVRGEAGASPSLHLLFNAGEKSGLVPPMLFGDVILHLHVLYIHSAQYLMHGAHDGTHDLVG